MAEEEINNCIAGCTNSIKNEKKNVDESLNVQRVDEFQDEQNVETRHTKNILDGSSYCASELTEAVPGSSKGTTKGGPSDQTTVWLPETSFKAEAEDVFNLPEREGGEESEIEEETEEERLKEESNVKMLAETGFKAEAEDEFSLPKREVSEESENNEESEEESDVEIEVGSSEGAYHLAEVSYGEENKECEQAGGSRPNSALIMSADFKISTSSRLENRDRLASFSPKGRLATDYIIKRKNLKIIDVKSGRVHYRNFECSICGYKAPQRSCLLEHIHKHTGEKIHHCLHCDKKFRYKSYLTQHITIYHTDFEAQFSCTLCGLRFAKGSSYERHIRTHSGERPFPCEFCDYQARHQGTLKEHLRTHTGEKPYECGECAYKCAYSTLLKRHVATHHQEQTYACDQCDYKTKQLRNFNNHTKIHSEDKYYRCDKCCYKSTRKDTLKSHIGSVHLNERFPCKVCAATFKYPKALRKHTSEHHPNEFPFECYLCNVRFKRAKGLTLHNRKEHSSDNV